MIREEKGRARSERTLQEQLQLLQQDINALSADERATLLLALQELENSTPTSEGPAPTSTLLDSFARVEWERQPVDVEQFIKDEYYLGKTCDNLYPKLLEDMKELFSGGYHECVLSGSIGWGKTFFASIGVCRLLYELSCMRDPQKSYGLAPGSVIAITCFSVNEMLAMKVVFENIINKLQASPYFKEHFPYELTKKEMRFPSKKLWLAARASTDSSALGLNTIGALVDECLHADAWVLLADGCTARVEDLCAQGEAIVQTFDFAQDRSVAAKAFFKRSTDQECFDVRLDTGECLRASWNHPVAVRRGVQYLFITVRDIVDGDEVLTFGEVDSRAPCRTRGEDQAALGGGEDDPFVGRSPRSGCSACESVTCGGSVEAASTHVWGIESAEWRVAVGRAESAHRCRTKGSNREPGNACIAVEATDWEEDSHPRVQAGIGGAEPHARLSSHGRIAAEDLRVKRVAAEEGRLPLFGVCDADKSGAYGTSLSVGAPSRGDTRCAPGRDALRVRGVFGAVSVGWSQAEDGAGFPGDVGRRDAACSGSEAPRVHVQPSRTREDDRRDAALRGARLGVRGLGRTLAVGRVVSKSSLGVLPTYDVSVPGYEVFVADGVLVHNTNFMPDIPKSMRGRMGTEVTGRAQSIYNTIKRRMKSRFSRQGQLPGMLFIVSSKKTKDDFTAKLIRTMKTDASMFVRDYAQWDVKPEEFFTAKKFPVLCGNEATPSKILTEDEAAVLRSKELDEGLVILDVPEEFRSDFENDLEGAIRDIGGISTVAMSPFIQRREKLVAAVDSRLAHPFSTLEYEIGTPASFEWGRMVRAYKNHHGEMVWQPLINPSAPRHVHIDPSLSGDCTGLVMAHVAGMKDVTRRKDGKAHVERLPIFLVDLALRIRPPTAGEIDLGDVRQLVYMLRDHGYRISLLTMDRYNSADTLQQVRKKGIKSELLSVDLKTDPYDHLKTAFYEGRVVMYDYPPLLHELQQLEKDHRKNKVDHPPHGSKDIADAMAGALFSLSQTRASGSALPILPGLSYAPTDATPAQMGYMPGTRGLSILVGGGGGGGGIVVDDDDGWTDF